MLCILHILQKCYYNILVLLSRIKKIVPKMRIDEKLFVAIKVDHNFHLGTCTLHYVDRALELVSVDWLD